MIPFKHLKIGPFTVPIKIMGKDDAEKNLGLFSAEKMTIWLNPKFENEQIEAETLLHETLHALYHITGLQRRDQEERIVNVLSTALATAFSANPRLLTYLKDKLS